MNIARVTAEDAGTWLALRLALWPGDRRDEFAAEIARLLADPRGTVTFIARDDAGEAVGFVEAALRYDYVNGCETSPVAFLEGIYTDPARRRQGVARLMVEAVADWGRQQGCTEFASDASIENLASQQMHARLGFAETQRVVYFRKTLNGEQ
jgi:aminoglycoside 6'-N-acetyltransferase I